MWHIINDKGDHFLTPEYDLAEACVKQWAKAGYNVGIHYHE